MASPARWSAQVVDNFSDAKWRLNNLYKIQNEAGEEVAFRMNWAQERFYDDQHSLNVILKARQLGFTTLIDLMFLDACVFNSNVQAGIIAQSLDDAAEFFNKKVKYPYDNLPAAIKEANPAVADSARKLSFENGSSLRVGTSLRGGTYQYLHVSEFGKIGAKYPEKAKEIVSGAFNTVHAGQYIAVESTAEGQGGKFYRMCERARAMADSGAKLTPLDFKFHFYAWWQHPGYVLDPEGVTITKEQRAYFEKIRVDHGIALTPEQQAWYVKKAAGQEGEMKREFPATPDEAFEEAIEGAYYDNQMRQAREQGRITAVPYDDYLPVWTCWDLGMDDATAIWFFQLRGDQLRFIDYYEAEGEAYPHFVKMLQDRPYIYEGHILPHDGNVRAPETGNRRHETLTEMGLKGIEVAPRTPDLGHDIQNVRRLFGRLWFDEENCALGLSRLQNYRKKWNDSLGVFASQPLHDENSHGADALRTGLALVDFNEAIDDVRNEASQHGRNTRTGY